jgi:23S rRNA (guanosine2251-2'-O)-methyltransferase
VTRELVYGRNAVREALRGRREVIELWVSERVAGTLEWLAEGPRPQVVKERTLTEAAGTADHQGVVAWAAPYPYADPWELAADEKPLLACLDQVTDPRNLGAVIRSAAGAGATGVVVPAHGAAQVTPAVCRSSAGTVEHLPVAQVTNVVAFLKRAKDAGWWVYGAAGEAPGSYLGLDLTGRVVLVFGAEGRGLRPLVARTCDALARIPMDPAVESLNVSVAAALFVFEARRQRSAGASSGAARPPDDGRTRGER